MDCWVVCSDGRSNNNGRWFLCLKNGIVEGKEATSFGAFDQLNK